MKKIVLVLASIIVFSAQAMVVSTGPVLEKPRNCESFFPFQKEGHPYESFQVAKEIVAMMYNSARYKLTDPQKEGVNYLHENLNDLFKNTHGLEALVNFHPEKYYRMETPLNKSQHKLNSMIWLGINQLKHHHQYDNNRIKRIHDSIEFLNDCFNGTHNSQQAKDRKRKLASLQNSRKKQQAECAQNKRRKLGLNQQPITNFFQQAPASPEL